MSYYVATYSDDLALCSTQRQRQHFCCLLESCSKSVIRFTFGHSPSKMSFLTGGILPCGVGCLGRYTNSSILISAGCASWKSIRGATGCTITCSSIGECLLHTFGEYVNHSEYSGFMCQSIRLRLAPRSILPSILERTWAVDCITKCNDGTHSAHLGVFAKTTLLSNQITCVPVGDGLSHRCRSVTRNFFVGVSNCTALVLCANARESLGMVNSWKLVLWFLRILRLHQKAVYDTIGS